MSETDTIYEPVGDEIEEAIRMVEEEDGYRALIEIEDLKDSIFDLAVDHRKKQREAIVSYAIRKKHLAQIDGTETRRAVYLAAFGESQKADLAKDEAALKLSQAIDHWLSKHGGPDV